MSVFPADGRPVLATVVSDMLATLTVQAAPPTTPNGVPDPALALVEMKERSVGLGEMRGNETRGPLPSVALKGGRLDALVRFELWAADVSGVDAAADTVRSNLLTNLDALRAKGFLKLAAADTSSAERLSTGLTSAAWRKTAAYRVLFEFHYQDTSGATGLITRIPVTSDPDGNGPDDRETHVVTGPAVRWDTETAPLWRLRGPARFSRLSALAYVPGAPPEGQVTVLRTYRGAPGLPAAHASLDALLAAVDVTGAAERHAQVTFDRLVPGPPAQTALLDGFTPTGDEVVLGNWEKALDPSDPDVNPDTYVISSRDLAPALVLPGAEDVLEISFEHQSFAPIAALYLKF